MADPLRAIVLGAGYAGQGHAIALRLAGVEIAGMASRTAEVGAKIAAALQIPRYSPDWRGMLTGLKPEIVAVGTPGGTHVERRAWHWDGGLDAGDFEFGAGIRHRRHFCAGH